jgi:hypothetical protein
MDAGTPQRGQQQQGVGCQKLCRQTQKQEQQQQPMQAQKQHAARHIPVRAACSVDAPPRPAATSKPVPVARAAPARELSPGEAATVIQSWWRMHRLAQQHAALQALMTASSQLREVASRFEDARRATPHGHTAPILTHQQYLELNELAMRVLLQLDCTPCGVPELRAVRKRLAASAIALLDRVQQAFSAGVSASMDEGGATPKAAAPTAKDAAPVQEEQRDATEERQAPDDSPAVLVKLVVPGSMCEACTQTDAVSV